MSANLQMTWKLPLLSGPSSPLDTWMDREFIVSRLESLGLSEEAACRKAGLLERAAAALIAQGLPAFAPVWGWYVPGRIEVLGKHTDYCGGESLVAAPERGFVVLACPANDAHVRICDARTGEWCGLVISPDLEGAPGQWTHYACSVVRRLARNFPGSVRGMTVAFASDLPQAAGMSSSSALVVGIALALLRGSAIDGHTAFSANIPDIESLAGYLATMENGFGFGSLAGDCGVGTFGGSEDHTAMLCAQARWLSRFAYCPTRLVQRLPVPAELIFAVAASGVVAEKTGAALERYNSASRCARAAVEVWNRQTGRRDPHLAAAVASTPDAAARLRTVVAEADGPFSPARLSTRVEHFLCENLEVIPAACEAFAAGDLERFGALVDRSMALATTLLGNQVPETIDLARIARTLGAYAASAFGAGFGGSVWAMVPLADAGWFLQDWQQQYALRYPGPAAQAEFFLSRAGPPATAL